MYTKVWISGKKIIQLIMILIIIPILIPIIACGSSTPEPSLPPTKKIVVVPVQKKGEIKINNTILRAGPGVDYDQIGTMDEGEIVDIVGMTEEDGWLKIEITDAEENGDIWVSSAFVSFLSEVASSGSDSEEPLDVETPIHTTTAVMITIRAPETTTSLPTATMIPPDTPTDRPTASASPTATIKPPERPTDNPTTTSAPPPITPSPPERSPHWGFQDNCLYPQIWTSTPVKISNTDSRGCLVLSDLGFETQDQILYINVQNPGRDERFGIYAPIFGDTLIEFNIRIDELETGADNELVSLGFGIISINPVNTETDGFIYYVIESSSPGYPVFLKKGERGGFDQYLENGGGYIRYNPGTNQRLSYLLEGNQLRIYIDGDLMRTVTLPPADRAFFIGYKFENRGSIFARISDLSIQTR
jgi:hypothetical protein